MRKYKVIPKSFAPKADYWEDRPFLPNIVTYEPDDTPVFTGLLDHMENPIYRFPDKRLIGFTNCLGRSD